MKVILYTGENSFDGSFIVENATDIFIYNADTFEISKEGGCVRIKAVEDDE